jgi:hypothetical protein
MESNLGPFFFSLFSLSQLFYGRGHAVVQLVEALRYKSEGRGFVSPMVSLDFFFH